MQFSVCCSLAGRCLVAPHCLLEFILPLFEFMGFCRKTHWITGFIPSFPLTVNVFTLYTLTQTCCLKFRIFLPGFLDCSSSQLELLLSHLPFNSNSLIAVYWQNPKRHVMENNEDLLISLLKRHIVQHFTFISCQDTSIDSSLPAMLDACFFMAYSSNLSLIFPVDRTVFVLLVYLVAYADDFWRFSHLKQLWGKREGPEPTARGQESRAWRWVMGSG